jgi:hypothetical protein
MTWDITMGPTRAEAFRESNLFTETARPDGLSFTSTLTRPDGTSLDRDVQVRFADAEHGKALMTSRVLGRSTTAKLGLEPCEEREGGSRYRGRWSERAVPVGWEAVGRANADALDRRRHQAHRRRVEGPRIVFEEYGLPGLTGVNGIVDIADNYPSKGSGERTAWFRDSEGNLPAIGQLLPRA